MLRKHLFQAIFILWATLCLTLFVYSTGQRSGVHLFSLEKQNLGLVFSQIPVTDIFILLTNTLKSMVSVAIFVLSTIGFGLTFLRFVDRNRMIIGEGWQTLATAFVFGQSIFSIFLLMLLIIIKHFSLFSNLIIFIFGLVLFFLQIRLLFQYFRNGTKNIASLCEEREFLFPFLLAIFLFCVTVLYSSSRLSYDAASQYFAQAKMIAASERFISISYKDAFVGSALYLTSIQSAIIQLFGDQAARAYSWMSGLVILIFCWMIGKKIGISRRARLIFLPLSLTTTAFIDLLGDGKIDLVNTASIVASVYWFISCMKNPSNITLFLASFLGGYAVVARPYNVILLSLFFSILAILFHSSAQNRLLFFMKLMRALIGLFPASLFWGISIFLVNSVLFGDPLAPLSVFGLGKNDWPFYPDLWLKFRLVILYPFALTYMPVFDMLGHISPLFLGFLPFSLLIEERYRKIPNELKFIAFSAAITLFLWISVFGSIYILEIRYVLFLWFLLFLFVAQLLDSAIQSSVIAKAGSQIILVTLLLIMIIRVLLISLATYSPISKDGTPHCLDLPMCSFFNSINVQASPGDRVLVLSPFRYYLRPDLFSCASSGGDYLKLEEAALQSPEKFWAEIRRQGYHFIIFDSFFNQYILRFQNLPELISSAPPELIVLYSSTFKDYDHRIITESIAKIEFSPFTIPETSCVLRSGKWQLRYR